MDVMTFFSKKIFLSAVDSPSAVSIQHFLLYVIDYFPLQGCFNIV